MSEKGRESETFARFTSTFACDLVLSVEIP